MSLLFLMGLDIHRELEIDFELPRFDLDHFGIGSKQRDDRLPLVGNVSRCEQREIVRVYFNSIPAHNVLRAHEEETIVLLWRSYSDYRSRIDIGPDHNSVNRLVAARYLESFFRHEALLPSLEVKNTIFP